MFHRWLSTCSNYRYSNSLHVRNETYLQMVLKSAARWVGWVESDFRFAYLSGSLDINRSEFCWICVSNNMLFCRLLMFGMFFCRYSSLARALSDRLQIPTASLCSCYHTVLCNILLVLLTHVDQDLLPLPVDLRSCPVFVGVCVA